MKTLIKRAVCTLMLLLMAQGASAADEQATSVDEQALTSCALSWQSFANCCTRTPKPFTPLPIRFVCASWNTVTIPLTLRFGFMSE